MLTIGFYEYDDVSVNDDRLKDNDYSDELQRDDFEFKGFELTLNPNAELIQMQAVDETQNNADSLLDNVFNDTNHSLGRDTNQQLAAPLVANGVTYPTGTLIGTNFAYEMSYEEGGVTKYIYGSIQSPSHCRHLRVPTRRQILAT